MYRAIQPAGDNKIKLKARESFEDIRKQAEKRIFELINGKLDSFLATSDYDW
jgi:hypothetical protein